MYLESGFWIISLWGMGAMSASPTKDGSSLREHSLMRFEQAVQDRNPIVRKRGVTMER
jgi:hypothetical protein